MIPLTLAIRRLENRSCQADRNSGERDFATVMMGRPNQDPKCEKLFELRCFQELPLQSFEVVPLKSRILRSF
ncbi:hypothetical protein VNO77_26942 [Canavalia gladiata]|uniref:Uncharacterized protein n=1 Tax=Canavalia gladiata TaxID=3824 RepID=A0AAN9KXY7_CANGL